MEIYEAEMVRLSIRKADALESKALAVAQKLSGEALEVIDIELSGVEGARLQVQELIRMDPTTSTVAERHQLRELKRQLDLAEGLLLILEASQVAYGAGTSGDSIAQAKEEYLRTLATYKDALWDEVPEPTG